MNRSEFPPLEVLFHGQGGSRACQTHARRPRDSLVSPFATSTHGSGRNHVSRFATWRVKTLPFRVICFHPQQRSPFRSRTHTNPLPCSTQTSSLPPRCASLIPAPSASHPRRAALALKPTPRPRSPSSRPRNASTPPRRMRGACVPGVPFRASWPGPSCQTRHHRAWRVTRLDSSQRAPRRAPVPTKGTAPARFPDPGGPTFRHRFFCTNRVAKTVRRVRRVVPNALAPFCDVPFSPRARFGVAFVYTQTRGTNQRCIRRDLQTTGH